MLTVEHKMTAPRLLLLLLVSCTLLSAFGKIYCPDQHPSTSRHLIESSWVSFAASRSLKTTDPAVEVKDNEIEATASTDVDQKVNQLIDNSNVLDTDVSASANTGPVTATGGNSINTNNNVNIADVKVRTCKPMLAAKEMVAGLSHKARSMIDDNLPFLA